MLILRDYKKLSLRVKKYLIDLSINREKKTKSYI